jgi:phenylalanyl-tRNA synthetase alpha chain
MATGLDRKAVVDVIQARGLIENSLDLAGEHGWDHEKLVGVLKSLEADSCVTNTPTSVKSWKVTEEGQRVLDAGSPEVLVFNLVKRKGQASKEDLEGDLGAEVSKVGLGAAMKNKWIAVDASKTMRPAVDAVKDECQAELRALESLDAKKVEALKKRKLVQQTSTTLCKTEKAANFSGALKGKTSELTMDMVAKGTWKEADLKPYNFERASGAVLPGGHLHPLLKVRTEIRNILLLMGFEEMETNRWVESSFWNFDTLFQPQQHPARDAHDTFFVSEPARAQDIPPDYLERVKTMHEKGGAGSVGWRYDWSEEEARKNILRTHTTAVSARTLYAMGQEYQKTGIFTPKKYFSIDRVFRNETLDATHLAEFHQVEGFVADRNIGLAQLIGIIREFFRRMGMTNLRFKPAYNPYTEPSMEIFGFHPMLNKWVEIGNSGVFRPEMLHPMGLPDNVSVCAWGISLERPTMIQYGIPNIRDLFGPKQDVALLRTNPVAWLKAA